MKKLAIAFITTTLGPKLIGGSVGAAHPVPMAKADCMDGDFVEYDVIGGTQASDSRTRASAFSR